MEPPEGESGVAEMEEVFSVENCGGFVRELAVAREGGEGRGVVFGPGILIGDFEGAEVPVWLDLAVADEEMTQNLLTDVFWTAWEVERLGLDVLIVGGSGRTLS